MKLRITLFTAISLFSLPALAASTIPSDLLPGWDTVQQTQIKADVSYLASDKLQGRLTFQDGDDRAVQWIADAFKKMGLKPVVGDSYLQPVPLIEYVPDKKKTYLSFTGKAGHQKWQEPNVYTDFYKNVDVSGEIVFAGYGITAPALNYDDYKNIDVRGKTVLIFEHEPQETDSKSIFNGTANTIFATNRMKALNAQAHGAVAVLIMPEPNRKHPSNQERRARIGGAGKRKHKVPSFVIENDELQIPIAILSDQAGNAIAGKELRLSNIQKEIDQDLKPRSQLLSSVKIALHERVKSTKSGTAYNVVGLLEGSDPTLTAETIIISAHHDHEGMSGVQIWHGADDNASGTAGVLEMARAMTTNNNAPTGLKVNRSVLFVVFAAEERGLLGAFYMAAHPLRPLATTRAMINFDMIGRNEKRSLQTDGLIKIPSDTSNRLNLIGAHYSPDYHKVVMQQNKLVGLELDNRFDNENALNVFFRSDQFPFVLHDIPALWWFTGFHPDYHHVSDTADKINYAKMQKILRLAYLSAYVFANGANVPRFVQNP